MTIPYDRATLITHCTAKITQYQTSAPARAKFFSVIKTGLTAMTGSTVQLEVLDVDLLELEA